MKWNLDFEIAAVFIQLVFVMFYFVKKHLPTRQNKIYVACLSLSFATLVLDLSTAAADIWRLPVSLGYLLNTLYFMVIPFMAVAFFLYILVITDQYSFVKTMTFAIFCVPAAMSFLMGISSPFTGFLFYFDSAGGYHQGPCYVLEIIANLFYIALAVIFVAVYKSRVSRIEKNSIYFLCSLMVGAAVIQGLFFSNILLNNAMTSVALVVVYLSLQNPDSYVDKNSGIFNVDAFNTLTKEYINDGKTFSIIYMTIPDVRSISSIYGSENVQCALDELVNHFKKVFVGRNFYKFGAHSFMIQENGSYDYNEIEHAIRNRVAKPFNGITEKVIFPVDILIIPYWHMPNSIIKINSLLDFSKKIAKEKGNNITIEMSDSIIDRMEREIQVEKAIENAINNNSIQMYYQPIYSTISGKISSCESLARLFDNEIGFIPPDEFINKAEENGSIIKLGEQIFERVCSFIKEHEPQRYGIESIHINLSPIQCKQENLADVLLAITEKYGVDNHLIDLEITETAAVEQNRVIKRNMEKLIAADFSFSLDDYGTGFSNTATIIQLPFSSVKIDKSLLWSHYGGKSTILPDLVNMFHNQRIELIVEGVETEEMVNGLTEMKCQNLQGYYFSKPLPQREFMSYTREFNRK